VPPQANPEHVNQKNQANHHHQHITESKIFFSANFKIPNAEIEVSQAVQLQAQ
jgi:hypothetical protein